MRMRISDQYQQLYNIKINHAFAIVFYNFL